MDTVRAEALIQEAEQLERDAQASLDAWIILGQSAKYGQHLAKARALRHAATIKDIAARREYIANHA